MVSNKAYKYIKLILSLAIAFAVPLIIRAETTASVLQTYVTEQTLTVFINAKMSPEELKCLVSNQAAEITASGFLSDENALTKTTVLVDISTSMPSNMREKVVSTIKKLIELKADNEEFRLIMFGDELTTLRDFSVDRYDLAVEVEKIKFNGTQSKIYDAIYNSMPPISQVDNKPTFYRTIVITDGVDDTVSGVTKEELFLKLQNEHYPVDVIAVSSKEIPENKDLAAIVRMSCGRYYSLNPNADIPMIAQTLTENDYFFFEAKINESLLDGATRQVDISDGVRNISIDTKFQVFNKAETDQQPTPTPTPEKVEKIEAPSTPQPSVEPSPPVPAVEDVDKSEGKKPVNTRAIIIGLVIVVIVVAIIVLIFVLRNKGKKETARQEFTLPDINDYDYGDKGDISLEDKTSFLGDMSHEQKIQVTIKLSNLASPSKTWTIPLTEDLLIGRANHCEVQLEDKSVSREQCKICVVGSNLRVIHLSSTNRTILNDSDVKESSILQSGDILKFGREALRVDDIQIPGGANSRLYLDDRDNSGKTESIF